MRGPLRARTALAVSALAHAGVLGALLLVVRPPPAPRPLAVRLLSVDVTQAGGVSTLPPAPPAAAARRRPHAPLRSGVAAGSQPLAQRPPMTAPALALDVGTGVRLPAGPSVSGGQAGEAGTGEAALAVASGGGAGGGRGAPGGSPSLFAELHRRLAEAARRCYPAAAQRFRLQGEVPVHFCLDGQGVATALRLEGSSGSPLLDRSALECVVPGAEPLPALAGCFLVPVHFGG